MYVLFFAVASLVDLAFQVTYTSNVNSRSLKKDEVNYLFSLFFKDIHPS